MEIPTRDVPQADSVEVIEKALRAVSEGAETFQDIAPALGGYDERKGRYYRRACEILGFTDRLSTNKSVVTPLGRKYLLADTAAKKQLWGQSILKASIFQRVIPLFESKQQGISREELEQFIERVTTKTTRSMVHRRVVSILSWLEYAGIIRSQGTVYVLDRLPGSVSVIDYNDPTEPLLPTRFELTEYNTVESRVSAFKNTIKYELDRTKRDRANYSHKRLTNLLAHKIRQNDGIPKSNVLIDLATQINAQKYIFEVKSATERNMRSQIRRGISQLYEYRYLQNIPDANLVLVLEKPLAEKLSWYQDYLINDRQIYLMWDGDDVFYCPDAIRSSLTFALD